MNDRVSLTSDVNTSVNIIIVLKERKNNKRKAGVVVCFSLYNLKFCKRGAAFAEYLFNLFIHQLQVVELFVQAVLVKKLLVGAAFVDLALVHDDDFVGVLDS